MPRRELAQRLADHDAGVADQGVEPALVVSNAVDQLGDLGVVRDVSLEATDGPAWIGLHDIRGDDAPAVPGQLLGHRAPDPRAAPVTSATRFPSAMAPAPHLHAAMCGREPSYLPSDAIGELFRAAGGPKLR